MAKEISTFNRIENYLKEISEKTECGGLWISEKMGRRISFVCGVRPSDFEPPKIFKINKRYLLLCEKPDRLENSIENILKKLREVLDES